MFTSDPEERARIALRKGDEFLRALQKQDEPGKLTWSF